MVLLSLAISAGMGFQTLSTTSAFESAASSILVIFGVDGEQNVLTENVFQKNKLT